MSVFNIKPSSTYRNGPATGNCGLLTVNVSHIAPSVSAAGTYDSKLNNYQLKWSSCTRDLGVYVDNHLTFAQHAHL